MELIFWAPSGLLVQWLVLAQNPVNAAHPKMPAKLVRNWDMEA